MNFADLRFWEILIVGLCVIAAGHAALARWRDQWVTIFDRLALMFLGLTMLAFVDFVTVIIFLVVAIGTYFATVAIVRKPEAQQRKYLWFLIPLQLAPLLYYKYADFIANGVLDLHWSTFRDLVIPAGISFYTFQKIAFLVDTVGFRKPAPAFLDYINFAAFFPQIVAGPIERREDLLPQMESFRFRWCTESINEGLGYITLGLFFKACLADNLAYFFRPESTTNAYAIWLANVIFGLRIYYDFAGYSLVAYGLARCLGLRLTMNFLSPYCSRSVTEFWRRWHITLGRWFHDYIYTPLGGAKVRWWALNMAVIFLVSGVWHGAGWNFVAWGAVHFLLMAAHRLVWKRLPRLALLSWATTLVIMFGTWLAFYETRWPLLVQKAQTLFAPSAYSLESLRAMVEMWKSADGFVLLALLAMAAATLALEGFSLWKKKAAYEDLRHPVLLCVLAILTVLFAPGTTNSFIYFAF